MQPDDSYWRRPAAAPGDSGHNPPATEPSGYSGPPRMQPPPPGWQPEHVATPPPPRTLPAQDEAAIDAQESSARRVTQLVAIAACAIILALLCAVCGRWVF